MRFAYAESFHAATRSLSRFQAERLLRSVDRFQTACEARRFPRGLGVTHLREDFFEFRAGIHGRVLYRRRKGVILYLLYGDHDDIRRFLRSS